MWYALAGVMFSMFMTTLTGTVWAIRQEGRINSHDRLFDEREKLSKERHEDTTRRLERIERKLDAQNGKH
jgi:hypothetical protein